VVALCTVLTVGGVAAGCGGTGPGSAKARSTTPARASRSVGRVRTLTQSELQSALVNAKDLPGWTMNSIAVPGDDGRLPPPRIPDVRRRLRATPAVCQPLYDLSVLTSGWQYSAYADQEVRSGTGASEHLVMTALESYSVADAPKVLSDLRTALRGCSSFRSLSPLDPDDRWSDPHPLPDPAVGDEAVSYRIRLVVPSVDSDGNNDGGPPVAAPHIFTVVRSGATVAVFYAQSFPDTPLPQIPSDLLRAQADRLATAG